MALTSDTGLSASLEDYLEAVLVLVRQTQVARVRDIARHLGVHMPSVTAALKALAKRQLVHYDPYQVVTLTDHGRELAEEISQRHNTLRRFFVEVLGLSSSSADANACRIEHAADADLLERLGHFARFIEQCPRTAGDWAGRFGAFIVGGSTGNVCDQCLSDGGPAACNNDRNKENGI